MNYIEFEIGGKLRGFKFGCGFLGELLHHFDMSFDDLYPAVKKNPIRLFPPILYFGHKHECIRKKLPITFELYDFEDWITELKGGFNNQNLPHVLTAMGQGVEHLTGIDKDEDSYEEKKN